MKRGNVFVHVEQREKTGRKRQEDGEIHAEKEKERERGINTHKQKYICNTKAYYHMADSANTM